MLKYVDTKVVFSELPDEISLAVNISGCPCKCKGCHSSYLSQDIGVPLTSQTLSDLIANNPGITAVCLLGGDSAPEYIAELAAEIKRLYPNMHVGWYSGRDHIAINNLENFDYIKVGPYIPELGALDAPTTNQRMYKVCHFDTGYSLEDITGLFW